MTNIDLRAAAAGLALIAMAAPAGAQGSKGVAGRFALPGTARVSPQVAAQIAAFEQRTTAAARLPGADFRQAASVVWTPYPGARAYQILRGASATGPWVHAAPATRGSRTTAATIDGLFPDRDFYFRVVALGPRGDALVALDSSNVAFAHTYGVGLVADFVRLAECVTTPQSQVKLAWRPVAGASGYRVAQGIAPPVHPREFSKLPAYKADSVEAHLIAAFVARDTTFTQHVATGTYAFAVEPLYRMPGDAEELAAAKAGNVVIVVVPGSAAHNFCP